MSHIGNTRPLQAGMIEDIGVFISMFVAISRVYFFILTCVGGFCVGLCVGSLSSLHISVFEFFFLPKFFVN